MIIRVQIQVRGIVQGVGFRPFIYALALKNSLTGRVFNNQSGVLIDIEGESRTINQFLNELRTNPPSLARIESTDSQEQSERAYYDDFRIDASTSTGPKFVPISPDVATCADCLRELFDPRDRRFRYPFINCSNCGPRFTIIEDVPYDRARTTMSEFALCEECRAQYENPHDRRFHAEPSACAKCGPQVSLISGKEQSATAINGDFAIAQTLALLDEGKIIAIKGIGGFHLACDAMNATTVEELRRRKFREDKPFALMARELDVIKEYCLVSDTEAELLATEVRPIVLLERRPEVFVPDAVAPRIKSLGFMLPYAPLHHLLFEKLDRPLVMTSANVSDEPICYEDDDARRRLEKIADYYLLNNRRIHMRVDDSVVRVSGTADKAASSISTQDACGPRGGPRGGPMVLRRSRGYAPAPLRTGFKFGRQILACGAELKNTFCLARDDYAFVSHHIGDLENLETLKSFTEGVDHLKRLFYLEPEVVAYDLHPEYLSSKYALALESIETKLGIQHHHAHIASCMADNEIDGEVIGVAMDGLGFGTDGRMWGGEFLVANFADVERIAHLEYIPMPGGAKAIREPWRMAAVYLQQTFGDDFLKLDFPFVHEMDAQSWTVLKGMIATKTNCPETSSMGRLFDAVSSLLRLRDKTNYEGQAAIELEQIADSRTREGYELVVSEDGSIIRPQNLIRCAVEDLLGGVPPGIISARFHLGVAELIANIACKVRAERKLNRVVLSGGVFQNMFLLRAASAQLTAASFEVFAHSRVPTNDGGISLGQAAIANARLLRSQSASS